MHRTDRILKTGIGLFLLLALLTISGPTLLAQTDNRTRPERDPLMFLKHALQQAGAAELSADQTTQLTNLITAYREQLQNEVPDETLRLAHKAYDDALIAGDLAAAQAAANTVAAAIAAHTSARLAIDADYKIKAIAVLKTNEAQYAALLQRFGSDGIVRIVSSLFGPGGFGPGGFGPGGPGRGPGGFGGVGPNGTGSAADGQGSSNTTRTAPGRRVGN